MFIYIIQVSGGFEFTALGGVGGVRIINEKSFNNGDIEIDIDAGNSL